MAKRLTNILICGGCGFMGSHFVRYLYNNHPHYRVVNLDLLTYAGNIDNLKDIIKVDQKLPVSRQRYIFVKGDIAKKNFVNALFKKYQFKIVINFAAESHVDRSISSALHFLRTNIHGNYVILEMVRKHKTKRFVYISTDEVYGDIPRGAICTETRVLNPTNPYAASKAAADLFVQSYMKTHNLPAVIIRSSNNYGSHQYPEKLHALAITNILAGKKVPVHGAGRHLRSWIHVDDFCSAVDLMMHKAKIHSIYNIAGEEKTVTEVVKTIAKVLGKNPSNVIVHVKDRHGPDFRYGPHDAKIRHELGWQRKRTYDEAVKDLVDWYIKNKTWWQKIIKRQDFQRYYKKQVSGHYTFEEDHGGK